MLGRSNQEIKQASKELADLQGQVEAIADTLTLVLDYETVKRNLTDKQIELDRVREEHAREKREIEHKLGLHKIQVEQERASAVKEAQLAVKEESLKAQEGRFAQEMKFMQDRFESEVQSQRKLVEQVLNRLPHFEHKRVEHIGVDPDTKVKLELTDGS